MSIAMGDEIKTESVIEIECSWLREHPANDPARSEMTNCGDLLPLIEEFGQRDPGRVRLRPDGLYEILSGHRRAACCRVLGRDFRAVVVDQADDAEAAREVILGNIRRDLDPIARAALLEQTIKPVDEGGAGVDRAEAGRLFGLDSESGIKGTLRLLSLPGALRELVANGTLPARDARLFVPFADAGLVMDRLASEIKRNPHMQSNWKPHQVAANVERHVRPVDGKSTYYAGYEYGNQPRRFEMDAATRKRLQVVTLPIGPKRKPVEVAQNVTLFDRLNKVALKQWKATRSAAGKKAAGKKKPLTEAERKQKAAVADKRLAEFQRRWSVKFQRCLLARQVDDDDALIMDTVPWMLAQLGAMEISELLTSALQQLGEPTPAQGPMAEDAMLRGCSSHGFEPVQTTLWRIVCYPSQSIFDAESSPLSRLADGVPDRLPLDGIHFEKRWEWLVGAGDIDVEAGWIAGKVDGPERELITVLLNYHTTEQLTRLAKEWRIEFPPTAKKKSERVAILLGIHLGETQLPLPKWWS